MLKEKNFQPALKSMDLIEVLNKPFKSKFNYEYILNFDKLAKWLKSKGYKTDKKENGPLNSQTLYENTGLLYDENYFDSFFYPSPKKLIKDGDTLIDIMLRTLNIKYYLCVSWVQTADYENYKEFFVECEGKEEYLKVVIEWCNTFEFKYEKEAGGIHIYDELQNDETDMVFVFLNYTDLDGKEQFTWLMHDLMAGDVIVEDEDLFDEIGALDINHIFYDTGAVRTNQSITRICSNIVDCITDTKEVIF